MQIVLQGPLDKYAVEVANYYLEYPLISKVIISCWQDDPVISIDNDNIVILRNKEVDNPGIGNRNRQIFTSLQGLKLVDSEFSAKMRTDQMVSHSSLALIKDFVEKFKESPIKYTDGSGPKGRVFVTSHFAKYPFHPRDHIFWGYTSDLINVFDIPLCPLLPFPSMDDGQYVNHTRAETYIGSYYYARFDEEIKKYIENPKEYLVDGAPRIQEVLKKYYDLWEKTFKALPPIQVAWPKRGQKLYPYYGHNPHGEVWDESPWRHMK